MNNRIITRIRQDNDWKALADHINSTIDALNRTDDLVYLDDRALAVEVIGRQRAIARLRDILRPFVEWQEEEDMGKEIASKREDAGL